MNARDHHYLFSHTHLRTRALLHPERIVEELRGPNRDSLLEFLWEEVESVASHRVEASGLEVEGVDALGAGTLAVVRMPAPQAPGESFFAAIHAGPAGGRYFVFDRAAAGPEQACLAELERDDTRVNLGNHPATKEALLAALVAELTGPVSSRPPLAPTVAMPSYPAGSLPPPPVPSFAPGAPFVASPVPMTPPPVGAAAPKKRRTGLWLGCGALLLGAPLFCCLAVGFAAYEPGLPDGASYEVTTTLRVDENDAERLVLTIDGPERMSSYRVEGPGAQCSYLSAYSSRVTCEVDLTPLAETRPSYRVTGYGRPNRFFGERVGEAPVLERTVEVARTVELAWSERARTTVIRGFPGRFTVTREGHLRLDGAPDGATLVVGADSARGAPLEIPLDVAAIANQVGVTTILRDGGLAALQGVTVRLADGTQASGAVQFQASDLAPALVSRFTLLGDAALGDAGGEAALWIEEGRVREIVGQPRLVSDVGRVVLVEHREERTGTCGPYALWGVGYGTRIPRMRWLADVTAYDRVERRTLARRTFRGTRPDCPYSIQQGTRSILGPRDAGTEADLYARAQLAPPPAS
ncbi:MAG: hypothetical protein KF729_13445 [Sandaracinaceae bacterium]|nr:hypothetical protein [Sandaracinaceae bacterium]